MPARDPRLVPILGWVTFAAAEVVLGGALQRPPSPAGAATELGALVAMGMVHAAAIAVRPGTALGLPELPALAALAAWLLAAACSSNAPIPGGGARVTGGPEAMIAAGWGVLALGLAASRIRWSSPHRLPSARAALAAAVVAPIALMVSAHLDPTLFPSVATLPPLGWGVGLATLACAVVGVVGSWRLEAGIAVALAGALASTVRLPAGTPTPGRLVLLVTVDTLRADDARAMGSVAWLGARGVTFDDALSTSSWTVPSLASVLTGRWPEGHRAGRNGSGLPGLQGIDASVATVAERLHAAGWRTGASVANPFLSPQMGFTRGFDAWMPAEGFLDAAPLVPWLVDRDAALVPRRRAHDDGEAVVDRALDWWASDRGRPTFLWVHVIDPHMPYTHADLAPDHPLFPVVGRIPGDEIEVDRLRRGVLRAGPVERDAIRGLYRDEVAWADHAVQRLLDTLQAAGGLDGATVIFAADHGEEFWDHGGVEHGHALWPEITHIPLVVVDPALPGGAVRHDPVSGVDVAATLLGAAGLEGDELDGTDLRAEVDPDRLRRIQGTLYFAQQQAVVEGPWALVQVNGEAEHLYDRDADPEWRSDRLAAPQDRCEPPAAPGVPVVDVHARLARLLDADWNLHAHGPDAAVDPEALRALGYAE